MGEVGEAITPVPFEWVKPLRELGEGFRVQVVVALASALYANHERRLLEDVQVLGDGGSAQVELSGEGSGGAGTIGKQL